jgi:hypothetical protein
MNHFEAKRAARAERLRERAEKKERESAAAHARADQIANIIPMGQPILVGHYSERRHRRDIERIHRGMTRGIEASREAAELRRRADAAKDNDAIFSDDPEAVNKLRAKLTEAEAEHVKLKAQIAEARRIVKKAGAAREDQARAVLAAGLDKSIAQALIYFGSLPSTGNSSANIRRLKDRIAELERERARPPAEPKTIGDVTIDEADNRVRLRFPNKPDEPTRALLKSWGFRWSPSAGAWQRHANVQSRLAAETVAKKIAGMLG